MAQRFGGEFSPEARRPKVGSPRPEPVSFRGRKPMRHGAKLNLLFALALLPLLSVFFQPLTAMATDLVGMGALLLSAWLTRDGVRAEDAFAERKVARRPAFPRLLFSAIACGAALFTGGLEKRKMRGEDELRLQQRKEQCGNDN